jgi:hypothetical protein
MAYAKEQLDKAANGRGSKARRWAKKQLTRHERRQAKRNPQSAPKRHEYRGYET